MDLNAYTRTISTVFSTNVKYVVPRFQREYSWKKEEVSELWNDVINNIKLSNNGISNNEYFIGSLVLIGEDKSTALQIVDGQQRLTTITILLSALVKSFNDAGEKDFAEGIYSTYIEGKDVRNKPFFKLENENPKPFLQESIQHISKKENRPQNNEEKTLWEAYLYFLQKLKPDTLKGQFYFWKDLQGNDEGKYILILESIRDQILNYLKVIYITVANEDDAYMIFETLNARGKNLSSVDLVKNDLFKTLSNTHPDDTAKRNWKKIQTVLLSRSNKVHMETFFRHYWLSNHNFVTESKIYKNFKIESSKPQFEHSLFLKDLVRESELYIKVANPLKTDWPDQNDHVVYSSLEALSLFQISQIRTIILALLNQRRKGLISHSDFCEVLDKMEKFHFKYSAICALKMNIFEGKYSKTARDIRNCKTKAETRIVIEQLIKFYKEREPNFELFKEKYDKLKFTSQITRDKKLIQYIFRCFEKFLRKTNELAVHNITLEHIDPQANGNTGYGSIGNLLPLDKEINEKCDNKEFRNKLRLYGNSNLLVVKLFLQHFGNETEWTLENQRKWFDIIVEYSYEKIWSIA